MIFMICILVCCCLVVCVKLEIPQRIRASPKRRQAVFSEENSVNLEKKFDHLSNLYLRYNNISNNDISNTKSQQKTIEEGQTQDPGYEVNTNVQEYEDNEDGGEGYKNFVGGVGSHTGQKQDSIFHFGKPLKTAF